MLASAHDHRSGHQPAAQRNPRGTGERLRDELIDTAVRVLAARGDTERLSIRAVAAEAQVSPAAVYRHFPDRRGLVRAAVEHCFDRFQAQLAQAEHGAATPFEALRRRCQAYVAFGTGQPHLYRVMFGAWSAGPKALGTYGRRPTPAPPPSPTSSPRSSAASTPGHKPAAPASSWPSSCGACCTA